jgi:hypothetical protein
VVGEGESGFGNVFMELIYKYFKNMWWRGLVSYEAIAE